MSAGVITKSTMSYLRPFFETQPNIQSNTKIEQENMEKLTRLVAKHIYGSSGAFLKKHEHHFDPSKRVRLVFDGAEKTKLDKITLVQYAELFDIPELKNLLDQMGIKQDYPFEREGKPLLHGACYFGLYRLFSFLLNGKVNADIQDRLGNTPLLAVLESPILTEPQKHVLAEILLVDCKASILKANAKGETPLHIACRDGLRTLVHLFLNRNPLAGEVLPKQADLNAEDNAGNTALHTLLNSPFLVEEQKHSIAKTLIYVYGDKVNAITIDINIANAKGETLLHLACHQGMEKFIYLFLDINADAAAVDSNNKTPIDRIAHLPKDKKTSIIDIFYEFPYAAPDPIKIFQLMQDEKTPEIQTPQSIRGVNIGKLETLETTR